MPVIFWTDGLIFLLLAAVVGYALYARKHEHLRAPWRTVAKSRLGMAAAVVLGLYVAIALLDSIHYHPRLENGQGYSVQVLSLFDRLAEPLRTRVEKSYSAPLATHLFTRESVRQPDGSTARDYPRLKYGGAHLDDPAKRWGDIAWRIAAGFVQALVVMGLITVALTRLLARRKGRPFADMLKRLLRGETDIPWHVILLTLGVLLLIIFPAAGLAGKYHLLGTDKVGQDVLFQALKSIRTGLVIGTLTTLIMLPFAVLLGIAAGYFWGVVDDIIQYIYTTLNSIPGVLLIAAAILMLQVYMANHAAEFDSLELRADMRLLFLCAVLGIASWTGLCRLLRGETLKLREVEYIQASQALGVGHFTILMRHVLPNVMHIVLITLVLDFSALVLAEAVLSYINIGVDPATDSWGNMINRARLEMAREPVVWWSLTAAFIFMFTLVLAANLFADAVRDAFDPRLRGA